MYLLYVFLGLYSYATIRGCFRNMFDSTKVNSPKTDNYLSQCNSTQSNFACLDQSTIIEYVCYCQGDYCNIASKMLFFSPIIVIILLIFCFLLNNFIN